MAELLGIAQKGTLKRTDLVQSEKNTHPVFAPPLTDLLQLSLDMTWPRRDLFINLPGNNIGDTLAFTFVDLEDGIQETAPVNYADIDVVGRAEAFKNFVGNTNRQFQITFKFRAQGLNAGTLQQILNKEVVQPAKWLQALKLPIIDASGISHPPPPCKLTIGRLFVGRVLVTDADPIWQHPFDPLTLLPYGADVPVTFTVIRRRISNFSFLDGNR